MKVKRSGFPATFKREAVDRVANPGLPAKATSHAAGIRPWAVSVTPRWNAERLNPPASRGKTGSDRWGVFAPGQVNPTILPDAHHLQFKILVEAKMGALPAEP